MDRLKEFLNAKATMIRWTSVVVLLVALVLLMRALPIERGWAIVEDWIDGLGVWGPLILGLIYILAVLLFIPGSLLTLAAGAMYGLVLGTLIVSLASTTAAGIAFLIGRYAARERVRRVVERSPKLAAVDRAIGERGWKIVALLRLSPAVPFNLQNYLYGVTSIRFWPCLLASWVAMLPGTFMYVYLGSLGRTAAAGTETSVLEWVLRGVGLVATLIVTVYLARIAGQAIQEATDVDDSRDPHIEPAESSADLAPNTRWPWRTMLLTLAALVALLMAIYATTSPDDFRTSVERLLKMSPSISRSAGQENPAVS